MTKYWLMKSEPETYSIEDLEKAGSDYWEGIRNYQARNFMRDEMKKGDQILFYHSSCKVPGVVGLASVSKEAYPDDTCWDPKSPYYDAKSTKEHPRWVRVDIAFEEKFSDVLTLGQLRETPGLEEMLLLKKGQRLSIQPLEKKHYDLICKLGRNT